MRHRMVGVVIVLSLVAVSCGGGGSSDTLVGAEATSVSTAATSSTTGESATTIAGETDVVNETYRVYGTWGDQSLTLDVYAPEVLRGSPVVVYLPGQGQANASPALVEALNGEGLLVFVVRRAAFGVGPDVVLSDHGVRVRAMGDSVACAIRFARARATELGSDNPAVVLTGFSMGGGVAAYVALFGETLEARWDEFATEGGPPREVECDVDGASADIDAVVGMAGTYDVYVPIYDGKWGRAYQQKQDPALLEFLSSPIGANPDLKVRMIHGTSDYVPLDDIVELEELLIDAGYDVQLTSFDGGHHEPPTELYISTVIEVLNQ